MNHRLALQTATLLIGTCTSLSASAAYAADYTCSGTEPFWSLEISERAIALKDLGTKTDLTMPGAKAKSAAGVSDEVVNVFHTRRPDGAREYVTIVVQNNASCSDGMSETTYSHSVVYITASRILAGCCTKR